ncbi:MAG: hypothetical protein AAGH15_10795 [Myxococcota bacterium]
MSPPSSALRRAAYAAVCVVMAGFTGRLLSALAAHEGSVDALRQAGFGVALAFAITGGVGFGTYVAPVHRLVPDAYYAVRDRQRMERLATWTGLRGFRAALLRVFWGRAGPKERFFDGSRRGLEALDDRTRLAELGHLASAVLVALATGWLAWRGYGAMAGSATLTNVFLNGYPILLQRWHRARLTPLLRRRR